GQMSYILLHCTTPGFCSSHTARGTGTAGGSPSFRQQETRCRARRRGPDACPKYSAAGFAARLPDIAGDDGGRSGAYWAETRPAAQHRLANRPARFPWLPPADLADGQVRGRGVYLRMTRCKVRGIPHGRGVVYVFDLLAVHFNLHPRPVLA